MEGGRWKGKGKKIYFSSSLLLLLLLLLLFVIKKFYIYTIYLVLYYSL